MKKRSVKSGLFFLESCIALALLAVCLVPIIKGYQVVLHQQERVSEKVNMTKEAYAVILGQAPSSDTIVIQKPGSIQLKKGALMIEVYEKSRNDTN